MSAIRMQKINGEIRKCVYEIISQKLKDPGITELVSVVRVETANDLGHAKVFISVFSTHPARAKATFETIVRLAPVIRRELARMVRLRTVPELHFFNDDSMEYSMKISKLIDDVRADDGRQDGER